MPQSSGKGVCLVLLCLLVYNVEGDCARRYTRGNQITVRMINAYRALHKDTSPICYGDRGMDKVDKILEDSLKCSYTGDLPFNANHVNVFRQRFDTKSVDGRTANEFLGEKYCWAIAHWFNTVGDFRNLWQNHRPLKFGNGQYSSRGELLNIVFRRATEVVCNHKMRKQSENEFYLYIACAFTPSSPGWTEVTDRYVSKSFGNSKESNLYNYMTSYKSIEEQFKRVPKGNWGQFQDQEQHDNQKDDSSDGRSMDRDEEMRRRRSWKENYETRVKMLGNEKEIELERIRVWELNNGGAPNAQNKFAFSDVMSDWKELPQPGQDAEDYIMQGNRYAD